MIRIDKNNVKTNIVDITLENILLGFLILTLAALGYSVIFDSIISSEMFLAIFTGFMAIFSYLQFLSLNAQRNIIEKEYQPDLELYMEGDDHPKLCIHNNGGSSAVKVEVDASNLSEKDTYQVGGETAEIPVIEPMQTIKVTLPKRAEKKRVMMEGTETLHEFEHKVAQGELQKTDLDVRVEVRYRDARGEKASITREFNLLEDRFRGSGIEYPSEDKERYVRGIRELDNAIRGLGNLLSERL